jgi:hypothetical protein
MLTYCSYEGRPTIVTATDAWWLVEGKWVQLERAEAGRNAVVIGESAFYDRFPQVPKLPSAAFQT